MFDYNYRLYIIKAIATVLFLPPSILTACLHVSARMGVGELTGRIKTLSLVLITPLFWYLKNWWDQRTAKVQARRHGAYLVPVFKGKSLGNIDVMGRCAKQI